ncbi:MAG: hypothetical protein C4531_12805 [Desulfurivibrio sp.]|nr:MAG: hypothetical protein C4531_12805 [Desulfurivibrio sp.]
MQVVTVWDKKDRRCFIYLLNPRSAICQHACTVGFFMFFSKVQMLTAKMASAGLTYRVMT